MQGGKRLTVGLWHRAVLYTRVIVSRSHLFEGKPSFVSLFLDSLRSGTLFVAAELRPPRAELASADGMDAWIDTYHAVRTLTCLLYTSDAADDLLCVDLGGRRILKK